MLKKHSNFFKSLLFIFDLVFISLSWVVSYYLRFHTNLVPVSKGIPSFEPYLYLLGPIVIIWAIAFHAFDLYRPRRTSSHVAEFFDIAKACTLSVLILISVTFLLRQYEFSRLVFVYFWVINIILLSFARVAFREVLRFVRRRGYNLRFVLVIGAGHLGQEIVKRIGERPELGLKVIGYLTRRREKVGMTFQGVEVLGTYDDLQHILNKRGVDQILIALPLDEQERLEDILKNISDTTYEVKIVPDLHQFITLRGGAEMFEGLPIITLQESPLYGWNRVFKRMVDIVFSLVILIIGFPFGLIIALLIKVTSPGPIFYTQTRMGLDGRIFTMLKFRTMQVDAEKETGPVWAQEGDPRRTWVGAFLRRFSLDEFPQFFNVLTGKMSIVGPRPERPELVEQLRKSIPKYMLRHTIKAGITGLAQVNGWRGSTSLEERIKCDLEYIEKWSLALDFKIMWLTLWKGFINKNAY